MRACGGWPCRSVCRNRSSASVGALDFDPHRVRFVQHPAAQRFAARRTVDERPKADALHDAAHGDSQPAKRRQRQSCCGSVSWVMQRQCLRRRMVRRRAVETESIPFGTDIQCSVAFPHEPVGQRRPVRRPCNAETSKHLGLRRQSLHVSAGPRHVEIRIGQQIELGDHQAPGCAERSPGT